VPDPLDDAVPVVVGVDDVEPVPPMRDGEPVGLSLFDAVPVADAVTVPTDEGVADDEPESEM